MTQTSAAIRSPSSREASRQTLNPLQSTGPCGSSSTESLAPFEKSAGNLSDNSGVSKLSKDHPLLCGPGPSNLSAKVIQAMTSPVRAHLDPFVIAMIHDIELMLAKVWKSPNHINIPVSGTGSAAWELCISNLVTPGECVLVFCNGYFGARQIDMARRYGGAVRVVEKEWGEAFSFVEIEEALLKHRPRLCWLCHAETSTGRLQPLDGIGAVCRTTDTIFLLDTVTSFGGVPLALEDHLVDICYTASQKCLSGPAGISAVSIGPRALNRINERKDALGPCPNWYLDLQLLLDYYHGDANGRHKYHHTASSTLYHGFREALRALLGEGVEAAWDRHSATAAYFSELCLAGGLEMFVKDENDRVPSLLTVVVPKGVDAAEACRHCLERYGLEIGQGLGVLSGKIFRVGLMGHNSTRRVARIVCQVLLEALQHQGWSPSPSETATSENL